jgi:hypothetical protein
MPDERPVAAVAKILQEFSVSPFPVYVFGDEPATEVEAFWKNQGARAYIEWTQKPSDLKAELGKIAKDIIEGWVD